MTRRSNYLTMLSTGLFCAGLFCIAQADMPMTGVGMGAPGSGGVSPINPSNFGANLIAWYKADTGVLVNSNCTGAAINGSNIKCWTDQSGNGFNIIDDQNLFPTYNTTGLNSNPTIAATNGSGLATGGATATFPITQFESGTHFTLVAVFQNPAGSQFPRFFHLGPSTSDGASGSLIIGENNNGLFWQFAGGTGFNAFSFTPNTAFAYFATYDGTTFADYSNNGVANTTSTPGITFSASPSGLAVCDHIGLGNSAACNVSEFYVLNTNINLAQVQGSYAYLKPRWSLP